MQIASLFNSFYPVIGISFNFRTFLCYDLSEDLRIGRGM